MIFVMSFVFCVVAQAHPPKDVILHYDVSSRTLAIKVLHTSSDPNRHYIDRIKIAVNGNVIIEKTPNRQNNTELKLEVLIPHAKTGDRVQATAFCNRGGELTKEIVVP